MTVKNYILCADDFGLNDSVSYGIINLINAKKLSATSCMTNMPRFKKHASLLRKALSEFVLPSPIMPIESNSNNQSQCFSEINPLDPCVIPSDDSSKTNNLSHNSTDNIQIGLHLNLTEGSPITSARSITRHGKFISLKSLIIKSHLRLIDTQEIYSEINAQIDEFYSAFGRLPDYIDGHQHIQHLPIIRNALIDIYLERFAPANQNSHKTGHIVNCKRLRNTFGNICSKAFLKGKANKSIETKYIKPELTIDINTNSKSNCIFTSDFYIRSSLNLKSIKGWIIALTGAWSFPKLLRKYNIKYNTSFSGIYNFKKHKHYAKYFAKFKKQVDGNGIIMCHPGLNIDNNFNPNLSCLMHYSRSYEYNYFLRQALIPK